MLKLLLSLLLFVSVLSSCNQSEPLSSEPREQVFQYPVGDIGVSGSTVLHWKEELDRHFNRLHTFARFNGNVLIARKGNIIYSGSFGVKNVSTKDSLDIHSLFQIASVSKTFTAMAAMLLVQNGALRLDQKLDDMFEGFPYPNVTVEDLLTHRSGLPNYLSVTEKDWEHDDLKTNKDLLDYLIEKKPAPLGSPGRSFVYNNTNYALLALVIEQTSGMIFEDYMQKHIFQPLGMNNTYIYSARNQHLPKETTTTGYLHKNIEDRMVATDGIVGDKNVYSTVEDLLKWERANSHDYLFMQSTLDSSVVGRSNEKSGRKNYGYGWRLLNDTDKGKLVYHNGWWHGYTATFSRNPADETVIIILSNIFNRATYKIQPVWDILYGSDSFSGEESSE